MAKYYNNVTEVIGGTPLIRINRLGNPDSTILAKMESMNPCASVKDRIGLAMIEAAERDGLLQPDTVIIEPTSGNTGIALASVCAQRGYKLILVMPESMSSERRKMLKILGAELKLTPAEGGMSGAVEEANRLMEKYENAFMPQQFKNSANPQIHRKTTAEEIWADTGGQIDFFVSGVGTGGTVTGAGEVLKKYNPDIKIIAVEPEDSPVLSGGQPGPHKIQGIGAGFVPDVLNTSIYDEIIQVSNEDAMQASRDAAAGEGLLGGISAGAALHAAIQVSNRPEANGKIIVYIFCDTAERYISTELFK